MRLIYRTTKTTLQLKAPCVVLQCIPMQTAICRWNTRLQQVWQGCDGYVSTEFFIDALSEWTQVWDLPRTLKSNYSSSFSCCAVQKVSSSQSRVMSQGGTDALWPDLQLCLFVYSELCSGSIFFFVVLFHSLQNMWKVPRSICFSRRQQTEG